MATTTAEPTKLSSNPARTFKSSTPRWSRARGLRKLAPIVFGIGPMVRIVGVSIVVGVAICVSIKLAFPQIQLGVAWRALFAIPAMFVYLGVWFLIVLLVPGHVEINEKYLCHANGQSRSRLNLSDIESSRLIICSPDHIRLIICAKGKVRKMSISASADLQLLVSLLDSTIVFDKRRQFTAARSLMNRTPSSTIRGE